MRRADRRGDRGVTNVSSKRSTPKRPHKLALYRRAVQHPQAEAAFLHRTYRHYNHHALPLLLREDFAGSCAVASSWVDMNEEHQAMAVESHSPTARWAQRTANRELNDRTSDLHIVEADVLDIDGPKVDITCALNFSTFIYHDRPTLKRYFKSARRGLRPNGMFTIDAYGGPGAMKTGTQTRRVPAVGKDPGQAPGFTYLWEQRSFDPVTHQTECRIHFELPDKRRVDSAFIYRWRLWTLPELMELMLESGFKTVEAWCDTFDPAAGTSDGIYRPTPGMPAREDWIAYVVGLK
jgi:SAM-dependent methyltransferase